MLSKLVEDLKEHSERAAVPAEVCRAALRVVFAVHEKVPYGEIGPRGQWGSARPAQYLEEIVRAYRLAVQDGPEGTAGLARSGRQADGGEGHARQIGQE